MTGLRLDATFIRNARFSPRAPDPWSVLRRTYTGPALLFNLVLLIAFVGGYSLKAAMWRGVNQAQQGIVAVAEDMQRTTAELMVEHPELAVPLEKVAAAAGRLTPTLTAKSVERPIWHVMLSLDRDPWTAFLAISLLLYNLGRYGLTRAVSAMREEEERSGYSPPWFEPPQSFRMWVLERGKGVPSLGHKAVARWRSFWSGYRWCWYVHAWGLRPLAFVALASFVIHAWLWLRETVYLPA